MMHCIVWRLTWVSNGPAGLWGFVRTSPISWLLRISSCCRPSPRAFRLYCWRRWRWAVLSSRRESTVFRRLIEDHKTGLLVPPRDPQALEAAIREILSDPTAASKMGAVGRAVVRERFTVDRMVADTTAIFDAAMQDAGMPPPVQKRMAA